MMSDKKTPMKNISELSMLQGDEYQESIVKRLGYDPKKEKRVSNLELMCKMLSTKDGHCDGRTKRPISESGIKFFFEIINDIKPIMFIMTDDMQDKVVLKDEVIERDLPIDLPFQTFSIEPADDWYGLYTEKNNKGMLNANLIVIHEVSPEKLMLYTLYNFMPNDNTKPFLFVERSFLNIGSDKDPAKDGSLYAPISLYLSKLDNRTANIEYKIRVKVKIGKSKKLLKLKHTAILIDPGKRYKLETFGHRIVEWRSSWVVRGHWRRFKGTGKNRIGQRKMNGWTWVNSHQKGEGDLATKPRIVK